MNPFNSFRHAALWLFMLLAAAAPAYSQYGNPGRSAESAAGSLLLMGAHIVDPSTEEVVGTNLLVRSGVIEAWVNEIPENFQGRIIDLEGKWIIPGLIDLHTHSFGNRAPEAPNDNPGTETIAQRVLSAGVTGFLDLFGDEESLHASRTRQRAGDIGGADIFASLSCLTATDGHCTEYGIPTRVMDTPGEARRVVTDLARREPDVVKIVYQPSDDQPSIDLATFEAAVATASELGLRTIVHIKTWQDIRDAIAVGASAVTHVPRGPIPDGLAQHMAEAGIAIVPTLTVETDLNDFLFDEDVLDAPLARRMTTAEIIGGYRHPDTIARFSPRREEWDDRATDASHTVGTMAEAGVTILVGTDSGNWGTIQGYSVHREMMKLVEAGMTPWDALAAATTAAGRFLRRSHGVRPGDAANLVVLNASPLDDIANTQRIHRVMLRGEFVEPDTLPSPGR